MVLLAINTLGSFLFLFFTAFSGMVFSAFYAFRFQIAIFLSISITSRIYCIESIDLSFLTFFIQTFAHELVQYHISKFHERKHIHFPIIFVSIA